VRAQLHASTWSIVLRPWYEAPPTMGMEPTAITIGTSQLRMLIATDFQAASSLRALIHDLGESSTRLDLDHEGLAEHIAWLIARGRIHVELELREPTVTTSVIVRHVEAHRPAFEPSALDEGDHWIEIEVVGPGEVVIGGLRCEITLPTGRKLLRATDRFGLIRIDGIEHAGECTIRFPELELELESA
jgi:hypothetical protein